MRRVSLAVARVEVRAVLDEQGEQLPGARQPRVQREDERAAERVLRPRARGVRAQELGQALDAVVLHGVEDVAERQQQRDHGVLPVVGRPAERGRVVAAVARARIRVTVPLTSDVVKIARLLAST